MTMINPMTPRLVELVWADLEWIRKVADAQYEGDPKLRSDAARTLIRISDRASEAISRLMAEGGLSKEPLRPLGPEVEMDLARIIAKNLGDTFELAFLSKSSWTHARGKAVDGSFRDINAPLQSDYRNAARAAIALLQANEVKRLSNPVDDGAVERVTHPEAQGNKDLGEPAASGLEVRNAALKEAAEIAADFSLGYGTGDRFDAGHDSACKYIEKAIRALVLQGASAPAPTSPQPIKGNEAPQ